MNPPLAPKLSCFMRQTKHESDQAQDVRGRYKWPFCEAQRHSASAVVSIVQAPPNGPESRHDH